MRQGFTFGISVLAGLMFAGCHPSSQTQSQCNTGQGPQIFTSSNALVFGLEFGQATYIGTSPINSLSVENTGTQELDLGSWTQSGDSAFSIIGPNNDAQQPQSTVAPCKFVFFEVTFTPTQQQQYSGSFTIPSNAVNFPSKTIQLAGCGVLPDGGTVTQCQWDAGG